MKKLYMVNVLLAVVAFLVLASSILVEAIHGESFLDMPNVFWVALHAVTGLVMAVLVFMHLHLNWNKVSAWLTRFKKCPNKATKALFVLSIVSFLSGFAAIFTFFTSGHGPIGGIHGKLALVFLIVGFGHLIKRIKWYIK